MRRGARKALAAFLGGAMTVTSAWAGMSLAPVAEQATSRAAALAPAPASVPSPAALPDGYVLAGAAKTSIEPRPADYGGTWERDREACATLSESSLGDPVGLGDHLANAGSPWPENPDCIYMGGFGIGPVNPVTAWDQANGLWVRAVALRDREGDDLVLVIVDGEGWFWDYAKKCADCGIKQLTEQLGSEEALGLDPENIVIAATHSHSAPDFIGGWGFVPDWYMRQVSDSIRQTVRDAVTAQRPAVLEHGEELAREFNAERRGTYRSAEEQQLGWLRAYVPAGDQAPEETIATIGAYAAHPTTFGTNKGVASADWVGVFVKSLEQRFKGIGLHFMTGLGNMSAAHMPERTPDLAGLVRSIGDGDLVEDPDISTARTTWQQPVTNAPLTALGVPGLFDRRFVQSPASVRTGEDPDSLHCASASPVAAEVAASAARIGDEVALTTSPGEIFSNLSNSIKENSGATLTLPLAQANDALGYMPQSFEMSQVGQQGLGFVVDGVAVVNYEDSYAIDKCFGDMALETGIDLLDGLR